MYIRQRGENLALERAIYEPAVLAADGKTVLKAARRSTKYIGSIPHDTRWSAVPPALLDALDLTEQAELRMRLARNEPAADANIKAVPDVLARAGQELARAAAAAGQDKAAKARVLQQWHELEEAWSQLQRAAQAAGLRRVVHRKPAPKAE